MRSFHRLNPLKIYSLKYGISYAIGFLEQLAREMPGPTISQSESLRVIGRDLDLRGIRTFIVRSDAKLFIVTGGYQPPPAVMPVTLQYASSDIDGLHVESNDGGCLPPTKDFSSLAEILSAIASYVTRKHGRLITISNTASTETTPIIIIKYTSFNSDPIVEILKGPAIYELCICVYKTEIASKQRTRFSRFSDLTDVGQRL